MNKSTNTFYTIKGLKTLAKRTHERADKLESLELLSKSDELNTIAGLIEHYASITNTEASYCEGIVKLIIEGQDYPIFKEYSEIKKFVYKILQEEQF